MKGETVQNLPYIQKYEEYTNDWQIYKRAQHNVAPVFHLKKEQLGFGGSRCGGGLLLFAMHIKGFSFTFNHLLVDNDFFNIS